MTKDYGCAVFLQGCGGKGTAIVARENLPDGCRLLRGRLAPPEQAELLAGIRAVIADAPLYHAHMPRTGKAFSVAMTNCGPLGWYSDKEGGYRYERLHPSTGRPWPPIPAILRRLWREVCDYGHEPEACLINQYRGNAKMGLHRDEDEADFDAPILSVSLGDSARFRLGGLTRRDPTTSFLLHSGDVLVMGGPSRLIHHGIDRIVPGSSALLAEGGRINLTLRRVTRPEG
jgi:alkylated DNA repair protein (DNA oxidative demethylase)